jgi:hypothetical protein
MTSTTGNRLPPRYTVRTVRTVRRHTPATVRGAGDATAATVRRPSNTRGLLLPTDAPMGCPAASPPYLRGPRFNADGLDGLRGVEAWRHRHEATGPSGRSARRDRAGNGSAAGLFRSTARTQGKEA